MERIDRILNHHLFLFHLEENKRAERTRIFCKHDMVHLLDVARIGWIINLEEGLGLDRELVYAAALLHDIGKHIQYEKNIPHEETALLPAGEILKECGFEDKETDVILLAIAQHRTADIAGQPDLSGVLYRADKTSRACFACEEEKACDWKSGKKNRTIKY